jgi:hypothetical protein
MEDAEAATKLATTTANKSTTDRARDLESQIAKVKAEVVTSQNVSAINPLAHALSQIIPGLGDGIGAMMQATIALVFELCIIGMMVGFELMGHASPSQPNARAEAPEQTPQMVVVAPAPKPQMAVVPPAPKPKLIATNPDQPVGSVKRILTDHLESAPGDMVEIADIGNRYRAVCRRDGKRTVTPDEFCTKLDDFCQTVGIKRKKAGEHLYLLDVRLASVAAPADHEGVMACK